jgi:mRNA-degrading endonuclease toxin of MazEF toxin-antitoxin module
MALAATDLVMVMPVTSSGRDWANHVAVRPTTLLDQLSLVMTKRCEPSPAAGSPG